MNISSTKCQQLCVLPAPIPPHTISFVSIFICRLFSLYRFLAHFSLFLCTLCANVAPNIYLTKTYGGAEPISTPDAHISSERFKCGSVNRILVKTCVLLCRIFAEFFISLRNMREEELYRRPLVFWQVVLNFYLFLSFIHGTDSFLDSF